MIILTEAMLHPIIAMSNDTEQTIERNHPIIAMSNDTEQTIERNYSTDRYPQEGWYQQMQWVQNWYGDVQAWTGKQHR